jgi:hypothetical protein
VDGCQERVGLVPDALDGVLEDGLVGLVDELEFGPVGREHPQHVRRMVGDFPQLAVGPGGRTLRAATLDAVDDSARQQGVLLGDDPLDEVIGDAGGDGLAGDGLAPRVGKEDEGEIRVSVPHHREDVEPRRLGQLVVAHHAVDVVEAFEGRLGRRRRPDRQPLVLALQVSGRQPCEIRLVVDVAHANRRPNLRHPASVRVRRA